jgi:hypothetical protein
MKKLCSAPQCRLVMLCPSKTGVGYWWKWGSFSPNWPNLLEPSPKTSRLAG